MNLGTSEERDLRLTDWATDVTASPPPAGLLSKVSQFERA